MPRLAANLSMLFTEHDFPDRFAAAANAGFSGVECQFPYDHEPGELARRMHADRLEMVLINLPAGDWAAGERGIACHPDRVDEFRQGVDQAIEYARALHCRRINCLAGKVPEGLDLAAAKQVFTDNLRLAATRLQAAGITLLTEPVNTHDVPGFLLSSSEQAMATLSDVAHDNLRIQYDVYHAQRMEGDLGNTLARCLPSIGHIQIADNPGRHEPGTGEINFNWLLRHLDKIGYTGWVGCEYIPMADTLGGLKWAEQYLGHA